MAVKAITGPEKIIPEITSNTRNLEKGLKMDRQEKSENVQDFSMYIRKRNVKFEVYGREMIETRVKSSGNSGKVSLPPDWVGNNVKIIRTD